MKKLIIILLAITVSASFAQTTIKVTPSLDTVFTTLVPAQYVPEQYVPAIPAQYIPGTPAQYIPSSNVSASVSTVIHAYKAPIVQPVAAPIIPIALPSFLPQPIYKSSAAVTYSNQSNFTISGLSFDQKGDSVTCITLNNCNNVHITQCRFANTRAFAIYINNCTYVTVDNSFITNVACGVYFYKGSTCKANFNQFLNINGNFTWVGHAVQWNTVTGGGNQANFNIIENTSAAIDPHDMISPYASSGIVGDSLQIIGNIIRGGQTHYRADKASASLDGAAGITLGDVSGNYQVARNNILINPAGVGLQTVGNGTGLKIDHNIIYINLPAITNMNIRLGISVQDNQPAGSVYVGYNRVLIYSTQGQTTQTNKYAPANDGQPNFYNNPSTPTPIPGWSTNKWTDTSVSPLLLPATIIAYK